VNFWLNRQLSRVVRFTEGHTGIIFMVQSVTTRRRNSLTRKIIPAYPLSWQRVQELRGV